MNIFVLDETPELSAKYQCNKHVVKMCLETTQLLSNAVLLNGGHSLYKMSHAKHPCSIWTAESLENFKWLTRHGLALFTEYTRRYGKVHKSKATFKYVAAQTLWLDNNGWRVPPKCMPEHCKVGDDSMEAVVQSYRNYYMMEKTHIAQWVDGSPGWFHV